MQKPVRFVLAAALLVASGLSTLSPSRASETPPPQPQSVELPTVGPMAVDSTEAIDALDALDAGVGAEAAENAGASPILNVPTEAISLTLVGTYNTGAYTTTASAAEVVAHHPGSQRLFVVNGLSRTVDIISVAVPTTPTLFASVNLSSLGSPNSVAVNGNVVAVAVEASTVTNPGLVVFMDITGTIQNSVTVGALPDMVTFSPNGQFALSANEGEPRGAIDPEGSVSVIDLSGGVAAASVTTLGFTQFSTATIDGRIRVVSPTATLAQDLEPEYITVLPDNSAAYVTLQENNAVAVINLSGPLTVTALVGLGYKNHNTAGFGFDASDRDTRINIIPRRVFGMYQPDAIAAYETGGQTYLITANEGDLRDSEQRRVSALSLDSTVFPTSTNPITDSNLGRLNVSIARPISQTLWPDPDGDGDIDNLYAAGARSFSIWSTSGALVFDSGEHMERAMQRALPAAFNNDATGGFDSRSDDKGPEPESVVVGAVQGRQYAFIGLKRIGGVLVYDVTNPNAPTYVQYVNNRVITNTLTPAARDLAPETLIFVTAANSPSGKPLVIVANEVSGSTSIFEIQSMPDLTLLHTNDVHARVVEYNSNGSAACSAAAGTETCVGGAPRLATASGAIRGAISDTLWLDAGDQFQGTLYYNLFRSDVLTRTTNALGYQAMAVGNHELDNGPAELRRFVDGVNFPVLSANMNVSTEPLLAGRIAPSTVITTATGDVYGVVGLTTEDTAFLASPGPNITFSPHVTAAQNAINALAAQGISRIVVLSHLGYDVDLRLASVISGADLIVGGHSHTFLYSPVATVNGDVPAGPYPTRRTGTDGKTVLVVQAFQWGRYLGRLNVNFTAGGDVLNWSGVPVFLDSSIPNSATVTSILSPTFTSQVAALQAQVVGSTTVDLPLLSGSTQICRQQECLLGNLVADAMLWKANEAITGTQKPFDIAIQNGGGLRAPITSISVTVGEVIETLPFGNALSTFEITGTHIITALQNGLNRFGVSGNGRFPQVAGLRYSFIERNPANARVINVEVRNPNGTFSPIDPNKVYRVVTNDFMRKGGDDYFVFRDFAINPYDFGPALDEAVVDFIRSRPNSTVTPVIDGRIKRLNRSMFFIVITQRTRLAQ
jgi:2',3'-cyclic-nucleotide 2'-phosphodiesterase / 3'-nucleotidase / 5'-nucleotidase